MAKKEFTSYSNDLEVKLSFSDEICLKVGYYSNNFSFSINRWTIITDIDSIYDVKGEKIVVIDIGIEKNAVTFIQNIIASLADQEIVAILCIFSISIAKNILTLDDHLIQGNPQLLFPDQSSSASIELQDLLIQNPNEVECKTSKNKSDTSYTLINVPKEADVTSFGSQLDESDQTSVETILNSLFISKINIEFERNPRNIFDNSKFYGSLINFIHQKIKNLTSARKSLLTTLNRICKYFKTYLLHHDHISVDYAIYLIILREIQISLLDAKNDKPNEANNCMIYIFENYTKMDPSKIEYSIKAFNSLMLHCTVKLQHIDNPMIHLLDIFVTYLNYNSVLKRITIKAKPLKQISKLSELEYRLMWYSIIMLCEQTFKLPGSGHSNWRENVITKIESSSLSIYDASVQKRLRVKGFEFCESLGLDLYHKLLLSDLIKWISYEKENFNFEKFNHLLEFLIQYKYSFHELYSFFEELYIFFNKFDQTPKFTLNSLMKVDPNYFASLFCHMMSSLAKLVCVCNFEIDRYSENVDSIKSIWIKLFAFLMKKIISFFISCCQPKVYSSLLFALYTTVKIPNQPSNIVRPWIKEYKASVKNLIIQDVKKCNIEMFFAIYNQFKITVLGVNTIHDYFSTYEPADNVSLLDDIWQSLFKIIFTLEAFPKGSLFIVLLKILRKYLDINKGLDFIEECLKFDLPSYGMKLEEPELSDSNIYNFMNFVETSVRTVFKVKLQSNLAKLLDYITPLRLPSLLYLTLMDPICKGITPENSIINTSDKNHIQIKHIIISLNVFCLKSLTASFTLEQISTSVKHIFVFKLFNFLIKSLNLHDIAFSSFPAILIPILLFYDKYTKLLTGFNGYDWKFDEIKIYIDFCMRNQSLLV